MVAITASARMGKRRNTLEERTEVSVTEKPHEKTYGFAFLFERIGEYLGPDAPGLWRLP
jgi:hypothetical protein